MRGISRAFFTGLVAVLPIAITIAILVWVGTTVEAVFAALIKPILPKGWYYPGMGLVVGFALILFTGLALRAWIGRKLYSLGERLVEQIPVAKTVYGAARDLIRFFSDTDRKKMGQVVVARLGDTDVRLLGLLTREDLESMPEGAADKDAVAVYVPMSYQMGGYTIMVPRDSVQPVDMQVQDALKFCLTAGMVSGE